MTGTVCSVATCRSNRNKAKKEGELIRFFTFPKNEALAKEWVKRCRRKDVFDPKHKTICSKHFELNQYEDAIESQITNTQPKRLKKTGIPSLHLPALPEKIVRQRNRRVMIQEQKDNVENILLNKENLPSSSTDLPAGEINVDELPSTSQQTPYDVLFKRFCALQKDNENLQFQMQKDKMQIETLLEKNKKLEVRHKIELNKRVREILSDFLSPKQIEIVLKKKTKTRWTSEEIFKAFTLRYFSKRAYTYLRRALKYPLPAISTLQSWASNIDLQHGMLRDILKVMDAYGNEKTDFERITVLSYDEIKVSSLVEYDERNDTVIGPHTYMQVIMARGLFSTWKQPIYVDFNTKISGHVLEEVITELNNINYNVVACVSDCEGENIRFWKDLDVSIEKTYFMHPVTFNKIYVFANVPHVLKLIRNWFVDYGFILEDGTLITKEPVKCLIEDSGSEISTCHKLSHLHIACERAERQNVALAAQLMSNTTATALKQYSSGPDTQLATDVGDFIDVINKWFDVMNSYTSSATTVTKLPYGKNFEEQDEVLEIAKQTFNSMRAKSKNALQTFQKGAIISTISLQNLFKDMKEKFGTHYMLTHRLSLDCLENLFYQIRSTGGLQHDPTPLNAIYRLRMILLGKNLGTERFVQKDVSVQVNKQIEHEEFILASAVKQASIMSLDFAEPNDSTDDISELPSETSSQISGLSSPSSKEMFEKDGLVNIAGYLAQKHQKEFPELARYTYQNETLNVHSYAMPSWVESFCVGGSEPSFSWENYIKRLNKWFVTIHRDGLKFNKKIVSRTTHVISRKEPLISKKLIYSFIRERVTLRIQYINAKKEENVFIRKKRKLENEQEQSLYKKMKKLPIHDYVVLV